MTSIILWDLLLFIICFYIIFFSYFFNTSVLPSLFPTVFPSAPFPLPLFYLPIPGLFRDALRNSANTASHLG
jgi:hypothetical protein